MRKRNLILISILIVFSLILNGQDSKTIKQWSVSLSYAPKFEIFRPLSPTKDIYFKGFEVSVNHKISKHLSFGVGINYQNLNIYSPFINLENVDEGYINYNYNNFDFPIQMNYLILNNPKKIDPYIKAAFINSYYHTFYEIKGIDYYNSITHDNYFILWDLGVGSFLKISNRLSLMGQASLGFGIKHNNPQYTFFKCQIGLNYYFIKKQVNS